MARQPITSVMTRVTAVTARQPTSAMARAQE